MKSYFDRDFQFGLVFKWHKAIATTVLSGSCAIGLIGFSPSVLAVALYDVGLTLKATPNPVAVNSALTYSFKVKNVGKKTVTNLVLKDQLQAGLSFKSASPDCKFANATDKKKNIITCTAKSVLPNVSIAWSISVKTPAKKTTLKNSASLKIKESDGNPVNNKASVVTAMSAGNRAPVASSISLKVDATLPYVEQKLIGTDADKDTLSYILAAPEKGKGYSSAYVTSPRGVLYVTLAAGFKGIITLPYRVTDGKAFSPVANVKINVQPIKVVKKRLGGLTIDPKLYASFQKTNLSGDLFGAPGKAPSEPASVDLSPSFPAAGNQGNQNSCVAWASAYALKSYQEGLEMKWPFNTAGHLFSPAFVYNQVNKGQDQGSQIFDALDLIIKKGAATFATTPYDDHDFLTQPSSAAIKEAVNFKAVSRSAVNGTKAMKAALVNRKPVVIGMEVFDQFYKLHGDNSVYNSDQGNNNGPHGRHAITVVGYDNNRYGGAFKVINSWGTDWGDNGYFWMPYKFAEKVVFQAWVLQDGKNKKVPTKPDDVVPPPDNKKLPNLQIKSWNAQYDPVLGGAGKLEWTVVNSGTGKAAAGAIVAVLLSKDNVINTSDTYVIYDQIPFALAVGGSAYRSFTGGNGIDFKIPGSISPGNYYIALWVDELNSIKESNENDNVSLSSGVAKFSDKLPDLNIQSWYAEPTDFVGDNLLTYQIINSGVTATAKVFSISLVLSKTQNLNDGKQWGLFYETYPYSLPPGMMTYRDFNNSASFNLYYDTKDRPIPEDDYYIALIADYENVIPESDKTNNVSFSWGLISTVSSSGLAKNKPKSTSADRSRLPMFNGKNIPNNVQMRKVKITATANGGRRMKFLDTPPSVPSQQALKDKVYNKTLSSDDNVIFPVQEAIPMPTEK